MAVVVVVVDVVDVEVGGGGKVAAKRQCLDGRLCGARIRLYKGLLCGRYGVRIFGNIDCARL